MTKLIPSMRLKVKGDTFFLPDPKGNVYFRNNIGSFRMEGSQIDQWVEKLLPMFNGEYTLAELTEGLPDEYQARVYEIAESLYQNGFVRDVSQDRPHQLSDDVLNKFAQQIEFLDNLCDSGAYRFQTYRQANVLAVGSGPFLVSLVRALLESGLPAFHILVTDSQATNRQRVEELAAHMRKTDPHVAINEVTREKQDGWSWREAVQPFDAVLYVSAEGNVEELRALHAASREEGKVFLSALCVHQVGLAGPLVHPDAEGCWESAWRRLHQAALIKDPQAHTFSATAGAMLANVIVFELFKFMTGAVESDLKHTCFLLDLETMEGSWHSFLPHPQIAQHKAVEWVYDLERRLQQRPDRRESNGLFSYFTMLTSAESGIFHTWDEGDLKQLPLAQCRVQVADPLSEGPAELLPEIVCSGLTHEQVRREAGLAGIESYVSRLVGPLVPIPSHEWIGVGAGETVAECVRRGLQNWLSKELDNRLLVHKPTVRRLRVRNAEDEACQFYLQALTTMQGEVILGLGEEVTGFPTVWVGTGGSWFGGVGLNVTLALRTALQHALQMAQNQTAFRSSQAFAASSVLLEDKEQIELVIPACEEEQAEVLQAALQTLKQNGKRLLVLDVAVESFLREELAGVFGVLLREEGSD